MIRLRKYPDRKSYIFVDAKCLGKQCFCPIEKFHLGKNVRLRKNVANTSANLCQTRYRDYIQLGKIGCPDGYEFDEALQKARIQEGWRSCA